MRRLTSVAATGATAVDDVLGREVRRGPLVASLDVHAVTEVEPMAQQEPLECESGSECKGTGQSCGT